MIDEIYSFSYTGVNNLLFKREGMIDKSLFHLRAAKFAFSDSNSFPRQPTPEKGPSFQLTESVTDSLHNYSTSAQPDKNAKSSRWKDGTLLYVTQINRFYKLKGAPHPIFDACGHTATLVFQLRYK